MALKRQPKSKQQMRVERQLKREQMGKPVKKSVENALDSLIEMLPDSTDPRLVANIHENSDGVVEKRVMKGKMKERCWDGYEPVPGKKPFSEGSCAKKSEDEAEKGKTPVGKKISKLVGEGKPQKQAVAIALDMERQGKLGPQGGYKKKSFIKAMGPGGVIFDFGPSTGNAIADSATALLNANADYVQSQNASYQANAYQDALTKFVTKGEAAYMGQATPFGHISEQGASMLNKPMDQQVKEAYERGEFDGATKTPGMAKSAPVIANAPGASTIAPPQDRSIPNIPNFQKSNTNVGGVQVHAQSPTDAAVIEMMRGYFEGQNDPNGVVADAGVTGGKVSITAGE